MFFREHAAHFFEQVADLIGFDGEDDHLGEFWNVRIVGCGLGPDFLGKSVSCVGDQIAGQDEFRREQFGVDETFGQGRRHFARAEKADLEFRAHGRGCSSSPREAKGERETHR